MCKVFAMTNMTNVTLNQKFIRIVRDAVCAKSDRDGFGYAVLGESGLLGGERTTTPFNFLPELGQGKPSITRSLPIVEVTQSSFGQIDTLKPKSFIGHARLSTNTKSMANTHPYASQDLALIHNGVVRDIANAVKCETNNDTEILFRYWQRSQMMEIEENVTGYYAMAVLDRASGYLHIVRDSTAMLYMSYCRTVHSYIIATTPDIIKEVAKRMKWKIDKPEMIKDDIHVIFDGNKIVSHESIEPLELGGYMDTQARMALGYDWQEQDAAATPAPSYREAVTTEDVEIARADGTENDDAPAEEEEENGVIDCVDMINSRRLA